MSRTISVVICAYDLRRSDLLRCAVESVASQHRKAHEIIVVVDHNEALLDWAIAAFPDITVVPNDDLRGLSGARNSGVRASSGEIIAFLDDDASASPNWLGWIDSSYVSSKIAGVGGAIYPDWETMRPGWFPYEFDWVVGCTYRGMPQRSSFVRNLIGANMSFRREALVAAGAFRNGIGRIGTVPVGCEETELCIRIGQTITEARFLYEPRATVDHHVPRSRATLGYFLRRCFNEGRSKAFVTAWVGSSGGLATERRYATRTLPAGIVRSLGEALLGRRPSRLLQGAAIATGLFATSSGFVFGKIQNFRGRHTPARSLASELPWITTPAAIDSRSLQR